MSDDRKQQIERLLTELLETPASERPRVLELACGADAELRVEVESLAQAYEEGDEFLISPDKPDLPAPTATEGPGARIGRYTLVKQLGEGGFGTVFLAEQKHPVRRRVALKLIKLGMDTKRVIARFNAERQALAMMDHPHIAKVLEAGATDAGRSYFVMELVEGVPVTRYCDQHKLTIRQRLELFIQVCQAVQHAHTKGIIHRDLKPSNILVTVADGAAVPKVIDFGIAKATQGRLTEQSFTTDQQHWLGTPQYMSPEQADGGVDIDTRTDVYSLGVILYELLCGAAPFDFKSSGYSEIQRIIREQDPPPPSSKTQQRELKGDLDRVVLKAMDKDRSRRYETPSALASDIQRYLNNEPVTARHAGRAYRLRKLVRRNRVIFIAGAAVALALAVGSITSTSLYIKARNAKTAESVLREDAEAKAYASDMLRIQQALSVYNLGEARMLLDRHRPKHGEKDRRGWEWRYLWQQCRGDPTAVLCQRPAAICSLSVSNDGRYLAIGEGDGGGLSVWDMQTRKEFARVRAGEFHVHTAFSPSEPLLAYTSATSDADGHWHGHVHLWDLLKRTVLATADLNDYSQGLAFSRDGKMLLTSTAGRNGKLTLWHVAGLEKARDVPADNGLGSNETHFAVTADLSAAVVAPFWELRAIDPSTGNEQWREDLRRAWASAVALSRDGRVLAFSTGTINPAIHLRDAATNKPLGPPLGGHVAWIGQLLFGLDGKTLISASADQTIRLWDVSDPAHAKPIGPPLQGHGHEVSRLALLPDNATLISGSKDGSVFLWNISQARKDPAYAGFPSIWWTFEEKGATLVSVNRKGQVFRHEGSDLLTSSEVLNIGKAVVGAFVFGGRLLLASHDEPLLTVWDLEHKKLLHTPPAFGDYHDIEYDVMTPEGHWLYYCDDDSTVREYDLRSGAELPVWRAPGGITAIAFTSEGRRRLTLSYSGAGILADAATGHQQHIDLDAREVGDATFSPDGGLLAVSESGYIGLWKTSDLNATGRVHPLFTLGGFSAPASYVRSRWAQTPRCVAFSPDGHRIAAGRQRTEAIRIWDVDSRQEVLTLPANGSLFGHTEFSPDGTILAASDAEGELHVWRAPTLAEIDAAEANQGAR